MGPTLVFTGNLAGYQGIGFMLAALRKVLDRRSDVRLTVVTSAAFDDYEVQARELGVRQAIDVVPAPIEQVPTLLAGSDVALNPRVDCDGIPVKLLNYMAAGRPVVSFAGSAPGSGTVPPRGSPGTGTWTGSPTECWPSSPILRWRSGSDGTPAASWRPTTPGAEPPA